MVVWLSDSTGGASVVPSATSYCVAYWAASQFNATLVDRAVAPGEGIDTDGAAGGDTSAAGVTFMETGVERVRSFRESVATATSV